MESKYLDTFTKKGVKELISVKGKRLVVEVLPREEIKSAGGLIVEATKDVRNDTEVNRETLCLVLLTGNGYYDEEGQDVPLSYEVGNVIEVPRHALKLYSKFPALNAFAANTIAIIDEDTVNFSWPSLEAYEEFKKAINA